VLIAAAACGLAICRSGLIRRVRSAASRSCEALSST
jgi:hypothetical protein